MGWPWAIYLRVSGTDILFVLVCTSIAAIRIEETGVVSSFDTRINRRILTTFELAI